LAETEGGGAPADLIETVYGMGYRLKLPSGQEITAPLAGTGKQTQQQTMDKVQGVWERCKEKFSRSPEQATTNLLKDTLADELRLHAAQEAHKLAGSLGMFGFRGSQLAREIEQIFQAKTPLDQNQALHLSELVVALRRGATTTSAPVLELGAVDERKKLLVVDDDRSLAGMEADAWGCGWILPRICPRPGMQSAAIAPCRGGA